MKITIFGSGYVGLVTGTCLAEVGNDVLCMDVDAEKVAKLNQGVVPIHEPGLDKMIRHNRESGRLRFTTDTGEAVEYGLYQFIAVGTPPDEDGSADMRHVTAVAESIARHMTEYRLVINKSTVPVGTAEMVAARISAVLAQRGVDVRFDVVSNPEFLKEGAAIDDFMKPDRIIVGSDDTRAERLMRRLYAPFNRNHDRLIHMDIRSAELTKYAANAMLATKISFMNELANVAERVGADIERVRIGIGSDPRIGYQFIYPGCGYGGSCFPKDVKALAHTAAQAGYDAQLLRAVETVNERQKRLLFEKINRHFEGKLAGKTVALWGLAFKPGTDDMREAPSRTLMEALWAAGAHVRAFDPVAMPETERIYGRRDALTLCHSPAETLQGADALAIVTEWKIFRSPDFEMIRDTLKSPVVFDGRNLYDTEQMQDVGIVYYAIGRGQTQQEAEG